MPVFPPSLRSFSGHTLVPTSFPFSESPRKARASFVAIPLSPPPLATEVLFFDPFILTPFTPLYHSGRPPLSRHFSFRGCHALPLSSPSAHRDFRIFTSSHHPGERRKTRLVIVIVRSPRDNLFYPSLLFRRRKVTEVSYSRCSVPFQFHGDRPAEFSLFIRLPSPTLLSSVEAAFALVFFRPKCPSFSRPEFFSVSFSTFFAVFFCSFLSLRCPVPLHSEAFAIVFFSFFFSLRHFIQVDHVLVVLAFLLRLSVAPLFIRFFFSSVVGDPLPFPSFISDLRVS